MLAMILKLLLPIGIAITILWGNGVGPDVRGAESPDGGGSDSVPPGIDRALQGDTGPGHPPGDVTPGDVTPGSTPATAEPSPTATPLPPQQTPGPALWPSATPTPVPTPPPTSGPTPTPTPVPPPVSDPILVGAGDIALCGSSGDEATGQLLDAIFAGGANGNVFTAGDNAYNSGTASEFADCYEPTWGRHKARTKPAPGNHDYITGDASGYFGYFGAAGEDSSKGYYSYNLGSWHIIVVNSNCSEVGGCDAGSPQEQWLRADLAANPAACTLAYWHHPRFSSGSHGSSTLTQPLWQALYDYDAEVVINGHDHEYERFAPQDPDGVADPTSGIRQFVVGTGGKSHYTFGSPIANSEVRNGDTYGVLKMTLHSTSFDWEFVPVAGEAFTDSGSQSCH